MFARLFPFKRKQIIEESFLGILKSLILYPISRYTSDIEEGLSGMSTNVRIRLMFPFDDAEREKYRDILLSGEGKQKKEPWKWQLALDELLSDPKYYYLHSIIIGPIIEELIFRGLFIPFISFILKAVNFDPTYSVMFSSIVFGMAHKDGMKLSATCAGYLWANMTVKNNGSLWSSIAGHISQNVIGEMTYYFQKNRKLF